MVKSTGLKYGPRNFDFRLVRKCVIWRSDLIGFQTRGLILINLNRKGGMGSNLGSGEPSKTYLGDRHKKKEVTCVEMAGSQDLSDSFCLLAYNPAKDGSSKRFFN